MSPIQAINCIEQFRRSVKDPQFSGADHDALREAVQTLAPLTQPVQAASTPAALSAPDEKK